MGEILTPGNIVVAIIVIVGLAIGGRRVWGGLSGTQSCCGEHEGAAKVKHVEVADTDESHYPYRTDLLIGGMTCENCERHVTDALNGIDGTWARVSLGDNMARILSKHPIDEAAYERAVKDAGYYVQKL